MTESRKPSFHTYNSKTHFSPLHVHYCIWENFGEEKPWQTIPRKNLANKLKSVYMSNTFLVYL